ncbi:TPA: helix-turn-helix transcriptional regulator [Staphylococcus aureus]|nr:helix-turn-helix transcriptional regulator [Staphylococcus aureus]HDA5646383.1 helix-turn-helix transcriptional regulator [Staphylococcus aureus]
MTDNYSLHIYKSMKMSSVKEANLKIIYWLQGTGVVSINLQQYDVKRNDVTVIMLNDLYQIDGHDDSVCCVVEVSAKTFLKFMNANYMMRGKILTNEVASTFRILIKYLIYSKIKQQSYNANDKIINYMCVELMSLNTYDGSRHLVAEEVHDYLTNNHHKKINRKDVINQVSITNKALSDMVKATPYSNFIQYLNHIRLEHCLIDILTSKKPIEEIASSHGFNHYSRFIHLCKETYGNTPKLIRKRYSPTSHSINHSQLVEIDKNIIELFDDTNQSSSSMREIDIPFEPTKRSQMYQPKNIYIKGSNFYWMDYYTIKQIIQRLGVNPENLHIIVTIDTSNELSIEQITLLLQKIVNYNVNVVFRIKHEYKELLTSTERGKIEKLVATIFNMTFESNRCKIAFLINDLNTTAIQKLKRLIDNYIGVFELIYHLEPKELNTRYDKEIDHLIDYFILPLRQIEQVSIACSKIICDVDLINENNDLKEKITMSDFNKVTELLTNYTKFRGLIMHMSIISEASKEINLTRLSIFIFIINILNQLRGIVIYQNDTMIVTKFKHEVQCVICLPAALLNENSDAIRLSCKGLQQFSHAKTKQIVLSIDKDNHTSENGVLVNDIMQQHSYWKANFIERNIYDHSLMVSSNSIVHLKYHLEI